jgi:hypothetical protein
MINFHLKIKNILLLIIDSSLPDIAQLEERGIK